MKKGLSLAYLLSLLFTAYAAAPVASNVTIAPVTPGTPQVNDVMQASYSYSNADNDPEGNSQYIWCRSDDTSGNGKVAIIAANSLNYTLQIGDANKYVSFEVLPVDQNGDLGLPVESFVFRINLATSTGITSNASLAGISMYPNPFTDKVTVDLSTTTHPADVQVYSATGQELLQRTGLKQDKFTTLQVCILLKYAGKALCNVLNC